MRCFNCRKTLKRGYFYNGVPYGPECFKKLGFRLNGKGEVTKIKQSERVQENELQGRLF